jgi:hypothetical protein
MERGIWRPSSGFVGALIPLSKPTYASTSWVVRLAAGKVVADWSNGYRESTKTAGISGSGDGETRFARKVCQLELPI